MNTKMIAVLAVAIVAVAGCAVVFTQSGTDRQNSASDSDRVLVEGSSFDWSYWLGNTDMAGVSDAKTPISMSDIKELWNVTCTVDSGSMNWKTPGSAICVGSDTYYYSGTDSKLYLVETSTGEILRSVDCKSGSVYNMAIAYGDGKIFVPCTENGNTVLRVFAADTLGPLFVSEGVSSSEVQGSITYHDGYVFFGTYGGDFACFSSEDTDTSRSDEVISPVWIIESAGWYNSTPAFAGNYLIVASGGYKDGGSTVYVLDYRTGAVYDTWKLDSEYCSSGATFYGGRVYIPFNKIIDASETTSETNTGKTMTIHSFTVNSSGELGSEKVWTSAVKDGGTQSTPVIYNDRLYICGGGSTMGSAEPVTVIDISQSGDMTTAYTVKINGSELCSKSTVSLTTAYATEENGYAVYLYLIEYGHVDTSDPTGLAGSADIYVLKDSKGQTSQSVVFNLTPSVRQFAYQSFTISEDGYILIRNDSTLFCYGHVSETEYDAKDVSNAIDRVLYLSSENNVNYVEVQRIEARYSELSDSEKSNVSNYQQLQALYRTVTLVTEDSDNIAIKVLKGSLVDIPNITVPSGKTMTGWYTNSGEWVLWTDRVSDDVTLTAHYANNINVTFDANGGSGGKTMSVASGGIIGYIADPVRSGYTFGGWFLNGKEYEPGYDAVSESITLTAKWLKDYTITFDSAGGKSADPIAVTYSKAVGTLPSVTRSGYTFGGWYLDNVEFTSATVYDYQENKTLVAKWTENQSSTVSNSKGISVTGAIPEDAVLYTSKAYAGGNGAKAMIAAAGTELDCIKITVSGEGVNGELRFEVSLTIGASFNGKTVNAYYYTPTEGAVSVTGMVSDGILTITVGGDGTSSADLLIGLPTGMGAYSII